MKNRNIASTIFLLFATSTLFAEKIPLNGTADEANPYLLSSITETTEGNTLLWKGISGQSLEGDVMKNGYVRLDKDITAKEFSPSGGGGPHTNMNLSFDDGKALTLTGSFSFNDWSNEKGYANYALGYYFSTAEGNTATINVGANQNFVMACDDNNFGGQADYITFGNFGRVVSIGKGITMNVTGTFNAYGHNADLAVSDSNFIVDGTLSGKKTVTFDDTILNQGSTGVITSASDVTITNTTATLNGEVSGTSVILGGNITQGSTGTIKTSQVILAGGNVALNGTAQTAEKTALNMSVSSGETALSAGSNVSVSDLNFNGGSLNLTSSITVDTISATKNTASKLSTSNGAKLTITNESTLVANSNLELGGNVDVKGVLNSSGTLTIAKDASVAIVRETEALAFKSTVGSTLNVYGDLTITGKTGSWHSYSGLLRGNINVDGGSLISNSTSKYSSAFQLSYGSLLSLKNGGSIYTKTNVFLQVDNGTITTDGTASIDVGGFMFANNTLNNSITITKASELKSKAVIFAQGGSTGNGSKLDLKLLSGDYEFSAIWSLRVAEINLYLGDGATVSFGSITPQSSNANAELTLVLHDFTLNTIKIGNVDNDKISGNVIDLGSNDTYTKTITLIGYDKNQNLLDANLWYIDNNGFLANYALTVPEPAEWAMILGSLALGFAIYRRRK